MKIFLDSANLSAIKKYNEMGIIDGITTNPTLLSRERDNPATLMREIVRIVKGPVSLEVIGTKTEEMVEQARRLMKYGQNVVVKIPLIPDGLKAVRLLTLEGIPTNVTLVFSANQALLAAKAGASYVSPFIGRLDDAGQDGLEVIRQSVQIFRNYGFGTKVLVASIRHPLHIIESGKIGADVVTLPPDILARMIVHPLTDKGLDSFLQDWERLKNETPNVEI
jgi:transaldolase